MRSLILVGKLKLWVVLGGLLSSALVVAQNAPSPVPPSAPRAPEVLTGKLAEVQALQASEKLVDALLILDELERDYPNVADIYNVRGSILLSPSMRDFEGAEKAFVRAAGLQVGALAPLFNLAEVQFVKHEWQAALDRLEAILTDFEKVPMQVRHLILFKKAICLVKLKRVEAAEALIKEHFTFMDDTPAYYFAKAAVAFQKEDKEAQDWLNKAVTIFGEKNCLAYIDCLMEARWVPNVKLPPVPSKGQ
jgi:tetratricopeptide (TPR) repeat protein